MQCSKFDGDEMNMHMPQNILAEIELRHLAAIPYQIVSPASNAPIIGIYQDSLLGAFQFTRPNITFTPREAMNLLMMYSNVNTDSIRNSGEEVTSFDILSQIMQPITLSYKSKLYGDKEDYATSNNVIEIRNGKYIRGQMEKSVFGSTTKGIIHRVYNDYGYIAAANFIDDVQNIITEYMKSSSFSVGISDLIANKTTIDSIIQAINKQKVEVQTLIEKVHLGIFENNTANTNMTEFELQVNKLLNKATEESGKIGRNSLGKDNRFLMIVNSGSKGNLINISQMIAGLGQQNVDGKRIPYGFDSRTLPHYSKYDDSPNARGFIENSYISGLNAPELFFHAMGGRIGLIDTAVKSVTWETPIIIIENDKPLYTEIGKWIDAKLDTDANNSKIQHFKERNMELLNTNNIYIPTTDDNGVVTWGEVTAITRHDPGTELYEIKTSGGRSVIVTESKSLLIWDEKKSQFLEKPTPEIVIGDCVPVTMDLCEPPITIQSIQLQDYLPKTEFIYGTDYNVALQLMQTEMQTKKHIQDNWWNQHNKTTFQLPYSKKASLQRASVRSNIENIQDGFVYPYHAARKDTRMSEQFELNENNGIFIGIFIAEGNVHGAHVNITNNNEKIRNFTKKWFEEHNISYKERHRQTKVGSSYTITGNCVILAKFLLQLVGHKAENKFIPSEAFLAPKQFITGLLNGYFSGDGSISKNSIDASSASKRLIDGISMLCSRLGIFTKISMSQLKKNNFNTKNIKPSYRIRIAAQWGKIFSEEIQLLEENKNTKMNSIQWRNQHMNYKSYNNCVLDKIVEIKIIGVEKHPKVYDLTIPSTLNFGLSNGLQVRDTSQTGYIQRRLIKGLEDIKVEYDMTVRNSKGKIVQFCYGEDGFDTTRVENQTVALVNMSIEDIYMHYDIMGLAEDKTADLIKVYSKSTITRMKKQRVETKAFCKTYIDKMIKYRDDIVDSVFHNKSENQIKLPVAFQNIIANIQGQLHLNANSIVDITPLEAFQMIEKYFKNLQKMEYVKPNSMFEVMYYYYLSPKDLLVNKRFHTKALTLLLETVVLRYKQALVHPGEMVGIIAGQSTGEPTTQMTLNSVTYETEILVRNSNKEMKKVQIGKFTEENIKTSPKIDYMEDKDTTYAELSEYYEVPCATEDGQTVWRRIEAVTQHPVINEDGTNTMLKLTTKGNREVFVTKAKSVLQLVDGKIQGVNGKDLRIGDYLPVSKKPLEYTEKLDLNLRDILSPTEYIYGSELEKARKVVNEHQWWSKHSGKTFQLPYNRSDSVYLVLSENSKQTDRKTKFYKDGFVYTKTNSICNYTIPEKIPLDYEFGYLVGAYAAEGCMTKHQISIANNDNDYLKPIEDWCARFNLKTKIRQQKDKIQEGWNSQDIRIYSTVLCRILSNLCGNLSHNKFVSQSIVFSNKECIMGFLDAYIGGDGTVKRRSIGNENKYKYSGISATSTSYQMLLDVQIMLKNLGINSKIHKPKKVLSNNRGTLSENIHQTFELLVNNQQGQKLASILNIKEKEKQSKCCELLKESFKFEYCEADTLVPNMIEGTIVFQDRNGLYLDMEFDELISIDEVPNTTNYAYDLTVEDTRNFDCYNGVALRDTFHLSGVASKSNVTRGVPRIEELLRLTKNPKNPSLTIHLKSNDEYDKDKAVSYANLIEYTKLADVIKSIQICFDPNEQTSLIMEDKMLIEQYYEFENLMNECINEAQEESKQQKSKWIIRMEMDSEILLEKNITMDDIHYAMKNSSYGENIDCIFSDFNNDKLIFRIRLVNEMSKKKKIANTLDQSDEIYILKNFQDTLLNGVVLRGVNKIEKVLPRKVQNMVFKEDGKFVRKDCWVLDTTGTNLLKVIGLDYIDSMRTYSNDIREIYNVLGVEAARQVLFNEISEVMEHADAYINYHHLSLLCDRMTMKKDLVPIFRSGILKDDIGPIAKATFEVHTEVLLEAARHADFDHMRGVSASVMCGQYGKYGTGAFNLVLDMTEMRNLMDASLDMTNDQTEIEKQFGLVQEKADMCSKNQIEIRNNIVNLKAPENLDVCDDDYDIGF